MARRGSPVPRPRTPDGGDPFDVADPHPAGAIRKGRPPGGRPPSLADSGAGGGVARCSSKSPTRRHLEPGPGRPGGASLGGPKIAVAPAPPKFFVCRQRDSPIRIRPHRTPGDRGPLAGSRGTALPRPPAPARGGAVDSPSPAASACPGRCRGQPPPPAPPPPSTAPPAPPASASATGKPGGPVAPPSPMGRVEPLGGGGRRVRTRGDPGRGRPGERQPRSAGRAWPGPDTPRPEKRP